MPSKNPSRLYLSPRPKATSNPPFLCWSLLPSVLTPLSLSVEIFISSHCTPTWALASSSTTLCPHLLSTRCLTQWGLVIRLLPIHTPWALGLSMPGTTATWWKLLLVIPFVLSGYTTRSIFSLTATLFPWSLLFTDCEFSPWSMIFHLTFYHQVVGSRRLKDQKKSIQHPGCMLLELLVTRDGHTAISMTLSKGVSYKGSPLQQLCLLKTPPLET